MTETTKGPGSGDCQSPHINGSNNRNDLTILNLLRAAELYRGRRGTGRGTRRQLAALAKDVRRRKA